MSKQDFDKILLEAIDEGLSTLGETSTQAIYFHLAKAFHIRREEIPQKIEAFATAIEKIFGMGASFLEILIMQRLYAKVDGTLQWDQSRDLTFIEYVAIARRCFLEKEAEREVTGVVGWEETVTKG